MTTTIFEFIKKYYGMLHTFLVRHKTYSTVLFLLTVGVLLFSVFGSVEQGDDTYTVTSGDVAQYVKVTGSVQASRDASLSFQTGGQVAYVSVKGGDKVTKGQVLATLQAGELQASLLQAEALLANKQASYLQLEGGARKEELAIKEQAVTNAEASLSQAYFALPEEIRNVDAVTSDALKNKFSDMFVYTGSSYVLSFSSCDQALQNAIETKRTKLEDAMITFQKKSSSVSALSSYEVLDDAFNASYQVAVLSNDLVNDISSLLLLSCSTSNTGLNTYRTTLSTVKTSMTTLFSSLTAKRATLVTAKNAYNQTKRDLELSKAGTDPYVLNAQSALVSQAEASVAQARATLAKTIITAPFSGVISDVDLSIGETVTQGKTVITMLATDGYEVEAKIPEIDLTKVKVGAKVEVTLDAYGEGEVFSAVVSRISPAATTEGTIPVYKATVTFDKNDTRIRQGMTANIKILAESKTKVITVPVRFVKVVTPKKGQVRLLKGKDILVQDIVLGMRGDNGVYEVLSGLLPKDVVLVPETTVRGAQKQTQ
jgi:HlyD family secretion protein